ncbi:MAG: amino acid decarboxylase [Clostridia bacterium]|nr:amino acid decarboxylase [Clostridia bacterium]
MKTPICDYVKGYAESDYIRLHMPGHKGVGTIESLDITEINGADSLYEAEGIIRESEKNASELFGCDTYYSTEGSSQCIKAMLCLAMSYSENKGRGKTVWAGRNAHKAFLNGVALLDIEVEWLYGDREDTYISCNVTAESLEKRFSEAEGYPLAVYLTSPDYLGNTTDISSVARVCKKYNTLLLLDNAHGAYLRFLKDSTFPIDLGADMCCSSAHKTLPVLTGGAYLHLGESVAQKLSDSVRHAMVLFGSTSPSYVILQSLDRANRYLSDGYRDELSKYISLLNTAKEKLVLAGYNLVGNEPLKITVDAKKYGYLGQELAELLYKNDIACEFADPDYVVFMFTPEIDSVKLNRFLSVMLEIEKKSEINCAPPKLCAAKRKMSVREALLSPLVESVKAEESLGRVFASAAVGCPPAIPIIVSGEIIDETAVKALNYYGIESVRVIK